MLIDRSYAEKLPSLDFDIWKILEHYSQTHLLEYTWNDMPPEFDTKDEYKAAQAAFATLMPELEWTNPNRERS